MSLCKVIYKPCSVYYVLIHTYIHAHVSPSHVNKRRKVCVPATFYLLCQLRQMYDTLLSTQSLPLYLLSFKSCQLLFAVSYLCGHTVSRGTEGLIVFFFFFLIIWQEEFLHLECLKRRSTQLCIMRSVFLSYTTYTVWWWQTSNYLGAFTLL